MSTPQTHEDLTRALAAVKVGDYVSFRHATADVEGHEAITSGVVYTPWYSDDALAVGGIPLRREPPAYVTAILEHRPARPSEPLGLGAVVSVRGRYFVRVCSGVEGASAWQLDTSSPGGRFLRWAEFPDETAVISEGVTP